ncbi:hypothetical protein Q5752_006574 [Cryptotrichosporon argae]
MHSTSPSLLVLTGADVDAALSSLDPETTLASQAAVFKTFSSSHTAAATSSPRPPLLEAPLRTTLTAAGATSLFMPSRIGADVACKIVSVPRADVGLPATTVVLDGVGRVRALVNARKLTAARNAAGSALSVRAAGAKTSHVVIFGTGAQASAHATLFLGLFPIDSLTIISRASSPRAAALAALFASDHRVTLASSADPAFNLKQAVHNADVILTLTPARAELFDAVDVRAGTHVVCVGSYRPDMREIHDDLVRRAGIVVVDSAEACLQEAGELISAGIARDGMAELGEVLERGWVKTGDVTLFKSVGIGLQDVAIAKLVLEQAEALGLGTEVPNFD